jgi:cytochrome c
LKVFYHPGFDSAGKGEEPKRLSGDMLAQGAALIEGSDCKTCHNEGVKTIGPAYLDVAKKYEFTEANVKILADKVIKGGAGVWGEVAMNAHPDLMLPDAEKMVSYVLSLDGEKLKVPEPASDLNLHVNSIVFPLTDKNEFEQYNETDTKPGLAAMLYKTNEINYPIHEVTKQSTPVLTGVAPAVHFKEDMFADNVDLSEYIYLQIQGTINIEKEGNYVFRLVSDDGSLLVIDGREIINNDGDHGPQAIDGEITLKKGKHPIQIRYYQGRGGYALSFQWAKHGDNAFSIVPNTVLSHTKSDFKKSVPYVPMAKLTRNIPGDRTPLLRVHPSFDLAQARPSAFEPRVGGMDFMSDSSLVICTWDSVGPVYRLEGVTGTDPEKIKVTRIATGLAEPLGIKVVNDTIYVLQKQELTRLIDHNNDGMIDEYQTVCDKWGVSPNFHEFAFGLEYKDGYFYAALATAIEPGGASANPQIPDRGKAVKISKKDGSIEFVAHGLRTPNGVGIGVDGEIFIADNQGDWLPSSKIVHVKPGAWYGSRSVDYDGTANLTETLPVVWLPQDEIGNSPSQPTYLNVGPYTGQQLHGEVTHGGLKRVFVEKVNGDYQGVVFRFVQGLEGGVNRVAWGPDGALYVGMIGNPGNWGQQGKKWFGLQKLTYNGKAAFEMLAIRAKSNGIEIEMTEPIAEPYGNSASDYQIEQWYYKPTENYGGPKSGLEKLNIKSVNISEDRKKVFLELNGMKANHVVYVRLKGVFVSKQNNELWTTEGWYTMNQIPKEQPGFKNPAKAIAHNTLTEAEKAAGWKLLFDGKSTAGWRKFKGDKAGAAWKVKDGTLYLDNTQKADWQAANGGDIMTNDEYENFEIALEWKIQPCGNSGIMFNVVESGQYQYVWNTGPEMQILDNPCHPDGRIEKHRAGDLYDMIETKFVAVNPAGEWNYVRLISNKGNVEFWLNGYKLVTFQMNTPEWDSLIASSKFKDMAGFGKAKKGHISLQDHGDMVWFRNIKIRSLN